MKVLIINQSEVRQLLPMSECIDVMTKTLKSLALGKAIMPLRQTVLLPESVGALGMMPAFIEDLKVMGLKVISVFPSNTNTEFDTYK